jgi:peptidoglycan-associated lipoprotein
VEALANSVSGLDKRVTDGEAMLTASKTADSEVARQVAELNNQLNTTQQRLAGTTGQVETLSQGMTGLDKRVAEGEAGLAAVRTADNDVARLVAELQASLSGLNTRLAGDEQALAANGAADAEALKRLDALETGAAASAEQIALLQGENKDQGSRISILEAGLATVSASAKEALERALAAGKLAEGKLLYEAVLTDDVAQFPFDKATLSKSAKAELKTFADKLKADNQNVYIEIQGHTDNIGGKPGNLELGQKRADAVMSYLNSEFGIPLHRMSALSYGESRPVADNSGAKSRPDMHP